MAHIARYGQRSDAMRVAKRAKHGNGDVVLAAEILCDAPPQCENTSDAMPRCRPLRLGVSEASQGN